jgi:hypothetical protein
MSTLRCTNLQDTSGGNSLTTAQIYNGAAKAWVNFNGTGTVAIRAQFNVSSITDNGTGDYTINFSTSMSDANYSLVGGGAIFYGNYRASVMIRMSGTTTPATYSTSAVRINTENAGIDSAQDSGIATVAIFR